jgi:hypothetical protein
MIRKKSSKIFQLQSDYSRHSLLSLFGGPGTPHISSLHLIKSLKKMRTCSSYSHHAQTFVTGRLKPASLEFDSRRLNPPMSLDIFLTFFS